MIPRSRLYIIIGVIGCAVIIVVQDGIVAFATLGAALGIMLVSTFAGLARVTDPSRHKAAFQVEQGKFVAAPTRVQSGAVVLMLVGLGVQILNVQRGWAEPDPTLRSLAWVLLAITVLFGLAVAVIVVLTWRRGGNPIELTLEGVATKVLWDRRFIPWEALAPGGPPRPRPLEGRIRLGLTRPELVRRSRFQIPGLGDSVPAQTDVHPWLISDAIRWYAEHPEDRAAIGTEAEHARLLTALGADTWTPASPRMPGVLKAAIRLGYAAVAFGLLSAVADVVVVLGFSDRLKAYAVEVGEQELRDHGGEPADWASGVSFSQAWYWIILVLMAILSTIALVALRLLKRGNEVGRIGLIVLSAFAIFWAAVPCFDIALDPPPDLAPVLIGVSVLKRLGYLGFGVAVLVLLVMPAARAFTKPRSRPA